MNFITKLLLVARKNTILVIYNRLSKITYFIATTKEKLVRLFKNNIYKLSENITQIKNYNL